MNNDKDYLINGVHLSTSESKYVNQTDKNIIEKLEKFRDKKLGFMTHFGIFSQLGIIESWALSDEVEENRWSQECIDWTDISTFKEQYRSLNESFNPQRLETDKIVKFIKNCGFNYFIIPTKHHDGFCLWNTKTTQYNVINSSPYKKDIYNAFRKSCYENNLSIGAYFSKADWANDNYWEKEKSNEIIDRHPTYDRKVNPKKWNDFVDFTHEQISEITSNEYPVDILWLDAGWVRPGRNQDINLEKLTKIARTNNLSTLIVDRACGGIYENYVTPEQTIPDKYMDIPWESCISLGDPFAYEYEDKYKNEYEITKIFTEIISKGGNLVINVAIQPNGIFPKNAAVILSRFGNWFKYHSDDIIGSRPIFPHFESGLCHLKNTKNERILIIQKNKEEIFTKYLYISTCVKFEKLVLDFKNTLYDCDVSRIGERTRITMPSELIYQECSLGLVFQCFVDDNK